MEPAPLQEERSRPERLRRTLARRHGEKLLAEVKAGQTLRARRDAASLRAYAIVWLHKGTGSGLAARTEIGTGGW
ncbi:hypothetical protein ACIPRD_09735 [Streptomyces sp. NPDC090108]|uniref:hypothetical protein n=1 Tax=Streptomyces sp. NPDC090108 TaxID=3365947 RepID=UPI0038099FD7